MKDKYMMAGANCKRSLPNKSGERKRLHAKAPFPSDLLRRNETVNKFIKTTRLRQTAQQQQIMAADFTKPNNKIEKHIHAATTPTSRILLRSSKQNPAQEHNGEGNYDDHSFDNDELENQSSLTKFSKSLREPDQIELQEETENIETHSKAYLTNGKNELSTRKIIANKSEGGDENDEMPGSQECDNLDDEEEDDQGVDGKRRDKEEDHMIGVVNRKQNDLNENEEKKVSCSMLNSFGNITSCILRNSRSNSNKAPISSLDYLEIQNKFECATIEQKKSLVDGQEEQHVLNKLESVRDADTKKDLNDQLDRKNTTNNAVAERKAKNNSETEQHVKDICETPKQNRNGKRGLSRQVNFTSSDDDNMVEKYVAEFGNSSSRLSSDTTTTTSCESTSQDNEDFPNGSQLRLNIKTQHQKQVLPKNIRTIATNVFNTQYPPPTPYISSISQKKYQEQCNTNNRNNNNTNACAIKCSSPAPTTENINYSSPIMEQNTSYYDPTLNDTKLNTDFHSAIDNNTEISPSAEDRAVVRDRYISSTLNSVFIKDTIDSNANLDINNTPRNNDLLDNSIKINAKRDIDNENLQSNNYIVQKQQGQEENLKLNNRKHEQYIYKYFDSSQQQHSEFELKRNNGTHQLHEKDIIDAADKMNTQIEQQQQLQYHQHVPSSYENMLTNHRSNQQQQHHPQDHEQSQRYIVERQQRENLVLMQSQQHSMQEHYEPEQLYQLQEEKQLHIHQPLLLQHQQQRHNLPQNQTTEQRQQQNSDMVNFLHPQHHPTSNTYSPLHQHQQQQHQQIHEVYHDLMMDEFHDDHNKPYKLGLSPLNAKHESQDDGYETSAGEVLTPKSHASSSHSVTPQHQVQNPTGGLLEKTANSEDHQQQQELQMQQFYIRPQSIQQELSTNASVTNNASRDPYHSIDDNLNKGSNTSLRNMLTPPHSHRHGIAESSIPDNFMVMESDGPTANMNPSNELFCLSQQPEQTCTDVNSDMPIFSSAKANISGPDQRTMLNLQAKPPQKRRGRKKKILHVLPSTLESSNPKDVNVISGYAVKTRKKHDRFNGMSEEVVVKRTLPDHFCDNLDIVIIGINPGLFAAYKGHHYAGPGNHFWKCLYLSGLTHEQMSADDDSKLLKYGIGFTNMVQRATKGSADLTRKEIKEGSRILLEKLQRFRPKIAVFNGKLIFEVFSGKKDFNFGRQPECVKDTDTFIWVMPSSSARCAQLPRAADKVPFYAALKKFRDYIKGVIPHINEDECVFTEERIKKQCEQLNFKSHQNGTNLIGESYTNAVGIYNIEGLLQNSSGYPFDVEESSRLAAGGAKSPGIKRRESFMMSSLVGSQQEKKKRGRPKKIRGQGIIDPVTANKIPVNSQLQSHGANYPNVLNLSMQEASSEMPKKKRGRPKKVKPQPTELHILRQQDSQSSILTQKSNSMPIQAFTEDSSLIQNRTLQTKHQHVSALYSTPLHESSFYSPMASPSLNCSYVTNTPPSQPHHDKLGIAENIKDVKTNPIYLVQSNHHQLSEQNLGETPPPNSPNICMVDFEPQTVASTVSSSNVDDRAETELNVMSQRLQNTHQRSRYNSPINAEHNTTEYFQYWLSPQHKHIHSPAPSATTAGFSNSPQQQTSLHYHEQLQMQSLQQHQELHAQWPLRNQSRYEDVANSHYMINSPQLHHTHKHHHDHTNEHQNQHTGNDVACKSLSGLEALVDQIPTISECESEALSSTAEINAQAAATAAVESRLQEMRNSFNDPQVPDSQFVNFTTTPIHLIASKNPTTSVYNNNNQPQQSIGSNNLLSSNFSVRNLAASSTSSNSINNHESYGMATNARPSTHTNIYHHSNLMAAAVLVAAAAKSPTNLSASTATSATVAYHAQIYMDSHAHLTRHVPVNSLYPPPTSHHHSATAAQHAAAAHHHATAHYGNAQHRAADYANNPYSTAAVGQSNISAAHTLHMPSANYPYGYTTASSQSNYSGYPHSHPSHHGHPHAHHSTHHLTIFDRLKPSDIGGYSGF